MPVQAKETPVTHEAAAPSESTFWPPITSVAKTEISEEIWGLFDTPAYVRRAQHVEAATNTVWQRCCQQRADFLHWVHYHLCRWESCFASVAELEQAVQPAVWHHWQELRQELHTYLQHPSVTRTSSLPKQWCLWPNRRWRSLVAAVNRFNHHWLIYLNGLDFQPVNELRTNYNRFYLFEKECLVQSPQLARLHFQPLPMLTVALLLQEMPTLPELPATYQK